MPAVGSNEHREAMIADMITKIHKVREEILTAFIAKYQLHPDECEQVTMTDPDTGNTIWFVRKRPTQETAGIA